MWWTRLKYGPKVVSGASEISATPSQQRRHLAHLTADLELMCVTLEQLIAAAHRVTIEIAGLDVEDVPLRSRSDLASRRIRAAVQILGQ